MRVRRAAIPGTYSEATGRNARVTTGELAGSQRNVDEAARELHRIRQVYELKMLGRTDASIALQLGVDKRTVARLKARAYEDQYVDNTQFVQEQNAQTNARLDAIVATYLPRALGSTVQNADGTTTKFEPDPDAAMVVLRAERDRVRMVNAGRPMRVEHTGAAGGPIVTANVEPREKARVVRQSFLASAAAAANDDGGGDDGGEEVRGRTG